MSGVAWAADELGRLLHTHDLPSVPVAAVLAVPEAAVIAMREGRIVPADVVVEEEHLTLLLNVLIRLEVRLRGDSKAMRAMLDSPADTLKGLTPWAAMAGGVEAIRLVRAEVSNLHLPKGRIWRVGHGSE